MSNASKFKPGKRCHCGCGKRAVAVFVKNGHFYGSWACANTAHRLATEPHDTAPDGAVRFRYLPSASELEARGFVRLEALGAERWLMPAECKGGKRARFYVERFRGNLITTRAYVCYSKADFELFLAAIAGVGEYAPLHAKRCVKRPRIKREGLPDEEIERMLVHPEVLELVREMHLKKWVPVTLSKLAQLGVLAKFKRTKPGEGPLIAYGLPKWVGPDNRILPQHRGTLEGYKRI